MCVRATEEGCVLREQQDDLARRVEGIDERLTKVELDVGEMRAEAQSGFKALDRSVANLAHDFGERMNNFDKRIVEEKEKWGDALRKILLWGAKTVIGGAIVAMGVNVAKSFWGSG